MGNKKEFEIDSGWQMLFYSMPKVCQKSQIQTSSKFSKSVKTLLKWEKSA
ncbi:hypothetical protein LQF63_10880 [Tetragenococcus koreensis]|nr:hypothetical protein [Tetragenococcus koreensis]MCF1618138.1 hypothetical protein [Tetragenococcus koreensis]